MLCAGVRMLLFPKLPRLLFNKTNYVKSCSRNLQISGITRSKFGAKPNKSLLTLKDCHERYNASLHLLKLIEEDPKMLSNIIFSDEGYVTLKRDPTGTSSCPYVIIWCGLTSKEIIGPYFFDAPVTGKTYLNMINTFLMRELSARKINTKEAWFQQDGHPAHLTRPVLSSLKENFNGQLLSLKTRNIWPRKSPDLNPLDFFVWPKLKKLKIGRKRLDVSQMKGIITKEINSIPENETEAAVQEFYYRLQACKTYKGSLQL